MADLLDQLSQARFVDWIGVNGQAVKLADGQTTGVWVASVESGSPAYRAGLRAGDMIAELERLSLARDGTMRAYCDVLRTKGPASTLQVKVLRFDAGEIAEGQINGRPLEKVGSLPHRRFQFRPIRYHGQQRRARPPHRPGRRRRLHRARRPVLLPVPQSLRLVRHPARRAPPRDRPQAQRAARPKRWISVRRGWPIPTQRC
ncbi:MAG: PDZ domain-containing protein [Actinobacteria bacterium]|nr:PDZ domain-containing protein [Actinomycetota bacterium]